MKQAKVERTVPHFLKALKQPEVCCLRQLREADTRQAMPPSVRDDNQLSAMNSHIHQVFIDLHIPELNCA